MLKIIYHGNASDTPHTLDRETPYWITDTETFRVHAKLDSPGLAQNTLAILDGTDEDGNDVSAPDGWGEIEPDDSMDGDHTSALASAGWGTDEDYYEEY
jgi:hypothetical protein